MEAKLKTIILNAKKYNRRCDVKKITKAFEVAKKYHEGQLRKSGEPYIIHPLETAIILTSLQSDDDTICAGILHDVVEDTECTAEEIRQNFGQDVCDLVEGVTKLGKIQYSDKQESQVENYRKLFLAMAKDIRVIMIKLSDRLHNMRTLKHVKPEKQQRIARETLEIYAPLANRLGIYSIKWELEDLCFMYLHPDKYEHILKAIAQKREQREKFIEDIKLELKKHLTKARIECEIKGRPKHFYSIYRKMEKDNKTIDQIYDLFALRVLVSSVKDCYAVLGIVHELYTPMPRRFKDYIAMPKPNMYQSLHNTLIGKDGVPFEVQIRTYDMNRVAEYGIAAHWAYKEGKKIKDEAEEKMGWIKQSIEWQNDTQNEEEYINKLKIDLYEDQVFVFTPKGQIKSLPRGSNAIDFAYSIHEQVGHKMMGAKINSRIAPISQLLHNGDIVEIITSDNQKGPSMDWLKIVKSNQARNKIQQWFKKEKREENISRGKELIEKEMKRIGFEHADLFKDAWINIVLDRYKYNSLEDMYSSVGFGAISPVKIISRLLEEYRKVNTEFEIEKKIEELKKAKVDNKKVSKSGIIVKGIDNCLVKLSRCCNPIPGDEIVGYITRGRGVSVHRKDCLNVKDLENNEENRMIEVEWFKAPNVSYTADIEVHANDRRGLIVDYTTAITNAKANILSISARTTKDRIAITNLTVEVATIEELDKVIRAIRKVDSVYEVIRSKG
ncbi:MAG: bifunctional (p)ppGpp synthetase/guanosine-3',5'-bis(diphosphate) 3'-pyrophosphohydrolase [Clostridiales bacterium]|nr:bifunctional (p)ppGpp synthetase/guanosine-3',5'-bis(diphosphate) 3'-pyrophosphohydrolase [Clostridiales bacterium]